jgi:hypothetical protein
MVVDMFIAVYVVLIVVELLTVLVAVLVVDASVVDIGETKS